jgi:predicted DCC family thiol-disulfide oxidoreductase YuxK
VSGRPGREPYSYRADPSVPDFPDDKPIIVFDGHCVLCSGWAEFVIRHDPGARFRLLAAQSRLGEALYRHYGLDPVEFETNLLVQDGRVHEKLDGTLRMAAGLGAPWSAAVALRALPRRWQDGLYRLLARNRFRLFGRRDACYVPRPADAGRFLG